MLLLSKYIYTFIFGMALVVSTSANAGLYGFTDSSLPPPPQQNIPPRRISNYRKDMRDLVTALSQYGKSRDKNFQILIHEGQYLLDKSMWEYHHDNYNNIRTQKKIIDDTSFLSVDVPYANNSAISTNNYISAIDGIVINNHYCKNQPASSIIKDKNIALFSIEQCNNMNEIDNAISQSLNNNIIIYPFISLEQAFSQTRHQLIINENSKNIIKVGDAENFSLILNQSSFSDRKEMIDDISNSNYDIIIIDPIFHNSTPFTKEEIHSMKFKKNGTRRLVLALHNLSEISEDNYLWQKTWGSTPPKWLATNSLISDSTYIVKYWDTEWKELTSNYFKSIIDSGYDGVFLTGLENHRYFENELPLE